MKYPNDEMLKIQFFELESVAAANERYPEEDNLLRDLPEKAAPLKRQFWWNVPCLALFLIGELV